MILRTSYIDKSTIVLAISDSIPTCSISYVISDKHPFKNTFSVICYGFRIQFLFKGVFLEMLGTLSEMKSLHLTL